ncbi:MAG: ArnT family glycosyltransferase [Anaerolineae bacterium]
MSRGRQRLAVAVIIGLFLLIGSIYSVATPIMEASDELRHYPYIKYIADGNGLPFQQPGVETYWAQEGSQPPLYYALGALLTGWINTNDLPAMYQLNPHSMIGIPLAQDNKNMLIHSSREAFPWQGTTLAIHLLRFFSLLLEAGAVYCTYRLVRLIKPAKFAWALAAMALQAFTPMFLFISASVNNDNLVNLLAACTLLVCVSIIQRGINRRWLPAVGLLLGAACLTKLSGLALVPLTITALVIREIVVYVPILPTQRLAPGKQALKSLKSLVIASVLIVLPVILVAGWWYLRNLRLYGEPLGLNTMLAIVGGRTIPVTSFADLWGEFRGFRYSFWGLFGAVNILMQPAWIYRVLDGFTMIILGGLVWQAARIRRPVPPLLPVYGFFALWIVVYLVSILRWSSLTMASQGRLLFAALPAVYILGLAGLHAIGYRRISSWLTAGLCFLLLILAITSPFTAIRPAYTPAPLITLEQIPSTARPFGANYGEVMRLIATEVETRNVSPGGQVPVTLYWQVLAPMQENYSIYLHVSGLQQQAIGQYDSYPGGGLRQTSALEVGQVIRDRYLVPVAADAAGPVAARISVGLYQHETMENLPVTDEQGQEVGWPVIGRVRIAAATSAGQVQHPIDANLDDHVHLVGFDLVSSTVKPGDEIRFTLHWQVNQPLKNDYTVFVHLVDADGQNRGSGDGPPLEGEYPTSFWVQGDWLTDPHQVLVNANLPAGTYRLVVGLYDPESGQRLQVIGSDGQPKSDSITLTNITVSD